MSAFSLRAPASVALRVLFADSDAFLGTAFKLALDAPAREAFEVSGVGFYDNA